MRKGRRRYWHRWYGQPRAKLGRDDQTIASSILLATKGGAAQRAIVTWHFGWADDRQQLASRLHTLALVLLPLGFFTGELVIHGGDPEIGILLVPVGALVLLAAIFLTARDVGGR
ncbi:MAG: hypothetical protein QF570_13300 [Myxococcota bacterium]|jgi:hypothetical protein|nr:hypothetical protein [Myxococcota bacterium]